MANPFPGMNPFLERPSRWRGFHQRLITYLAEMLEPMLPDDYSAEIDERIYVASPPKDMYPDVFVVKHGERKREQNGRSNVAVLEPDPFVEAEFSVTEVHEPFVEIRVGGDPGELVGVIEILSPANKIPGVGRDLYLEKQANLLNSEVHLLEIDLLRAGRHTVAMPREGLPDSGRDYVVCLHRGGWRSKFRYWTIALQERLPRVNVPLSGPDADVVVDLQAVLNRAHTAGKGRRVDYTQECPPPLSRKDAKWVDGLLRKKKLRK